MICRVQLSTCIFAFSRCFLIEQNKHKKAIFKIKSIQKSPIKASLTYSLQQCFSLLRCQIAEGGSVYTECCWIRSVLIFYPCTHALDGPIWPLCDVWWSWTINTFSRHWLCCVNLISSALKTLSFRAVCSQ